LWCVRGAREFSTGRGASGKPLKGPWKHVGIHALDEHTLQIELTRPMQRFLDVLAFYALMPVHRRSLEEMQARFPETWRMEWTKPRTWCATGPSA
jgi:ABC-type oligopeptide transport system substrate-binding subunit